MMSCGVLLLDSSAVAPPTSRWRRWLYCLLLLVNAPLLLMVVGALTLPAFSMLAVLLGSLKVRRGLCICCQSSYHLYLQVFGLFNRFWPFRWLATLLALATTVVVSPVAGVCDLIFRLGFSALMSLHLLHFDPRRPLSQPG